LLLLSAICRLGHHNVDEPFCTVLADCSYVSRLGDIGSATVVRAHPSVTRSQNRLSGSSSTSLPNSQTIVTIPTATNIDSHASPSSNAQSSLSTTTKTRIGIGASVAGVVIIALLDVVLLLLRRKRNDAYVSTPQCMPSDLPEVMTRQGNGVSRHGNIVRSELGVGDAWFYSHELGLGRSRNVAAELHAPR
jgi:hypothetical protein